MSQSRDTHRRAALPKRFCSRRDRSDKPSSSRCRGSSESRGVIVPETPWSCERGTRVTLLPPGKGRGGTAVWGDRCCSPGAAVRLLPTPRSLAAQHLGNSFLLHCGQCPDYSWKPPVPSDLSLASTPRCRCRSPAQAALGCCPQGAGRQKGAGVCTAGVFLAQNASLQQAGREGRKGGRAPGGGNPGGTSVPHPGFVPWLHLLQWGCAHKRFKMPRGLGHLWRRDVTETARAQPRGPVRVCLRGFYLGHSPSGRRRDAPAPGKGEVCCFPPAEDTAPFVSVG